MPLRSLLVYSLGRTTGKDICSATVDCVTKKLSRNFENLVEICTDGAPAICKKRNGAMALLQEHIEERLSLTSAFYANNFYAARF